MKMMRKKYTEVTAWVMQQPVLMLANESDEKINWVRE